MGGPEVQRPLSETTGSRRSSPEGEGLEVNPVRAAPGAPLKLGPCTHPFCLALLRRGPWGLCQGQALHRGQAVPPARRLTSSSLSFPFIQDRPAGSCPSLAAAELPGGSGCREV